MIPFTLLVYLICYHTGDVTFYVTVRLWQEINK